MKPSLLSALIPVVVFALAMVNGARADDVTEAPMPVVTKVLTTVTFERLGVNLGGCLHRTADSSPI
jgi:hypothetical protein